MTRKTNSTRKARKTRNRKPLNLKNLRTMWRKANPIARIGMVATATVAAIAAIAIIVGAVRFIGWRVQVNEALTAQSQSQSQYDFNPGNIISDGTFFNGNALSEQQVSTIIEQQGVACSGERCLKSMTFSTESQSADEYCQAYDGGPNESAAAIVYKAGKACGISQKVLLTVLQKEQHLLTATNPNDFQFKAMMRTATPPMPASSNRCTARPNGTSTIFGTRDATATMPDGSITSSTIQMPAAAAATCTSRTERPRCCTYTPRISRMPRRSKRGPVKAIPARHTATAISRLSTIRCSAAREADASQ